MRSHFDSKPRILVSVALFTAGLAVSQGCSSEKGGSFQPTFLGNRAPVIQQFPDTAASIGDSLTLAISAQDPDGEPVWLHLTIHLTLDEFKKGYRPKAGISQGVFWFVPQAQDFPVRQFRIEVYDDELAADSTDFTVHVQ